MDGCNGNTQYYGTIKACRGYFSIWGLPEYVVSDNGPAYASGAFREFSRINNVTHYLIPPYHPATNGAAENAVRTFKNKFKVLIQYMPREDALMEFSCCYRNTPHCTTGCTPSELHIEFKTRTRLDALKTAKKNVEISQDRQRYYVRGNRTVEFSNRDNVVMRNYSVNARKWSDAQVSKKLGPVTYVLRTPTNDIVKRHANQLIPTEGMATIDRGKDGDRGSDVKMSFWRRPFENQIEQSSYPLDHQIVGTTIPSNHDESQTNILESDASISNSNNDSIVPLRRSARSIRKPDRLNL